MQNGCQGQSDWKKRKCSMLRLEKKEMLNAAIGNKRKRSMLRLEKKETLKSRNQQWTEDVTDQRHLAAFRFESQREYTCQCTLQLAVSDLPDFLNLANNEETAVFVDFASDNCPN